MLNIKAERCSFVLSVRLVHFGSFGARVVAHLNLHSASFLLRVSLQATAEEARALAARISSNAPQLRLPQGALLTYDPANATISDATASTSRNHSFRSRERPTAALSSGSSPAAIEALLAPQAPELAVKAHARK